MRRDSVLDVLALAFDEMGIEFFEPWEFIPESHKAPPLPLIAHILPTVKLLDMARRDLGRITINSAYRDPEYNRSVGGSSKSQHIEFTAADCDPHDVTPGQLYHWLDCSAYRRRIGMGLYNTFVHLDTRHWFGMPGFGFDVAPARWDKTDG